MSIIIWHNPRCSKSRAGVKYLEEKGVDIMRSENTSTILPPLKRSVRFWENSVSPPES